MKLTGLLILAMTCVYIGQKMSLKLRMRITELEKWIKIIKYMRERIRLEVPIPIIFEEIKTRNGYYLETVEKLKKNIESDKTPLKGGDKDIINSFLNGLESIDIQGQLDNCDIHSNMLCSNKDEAMLEYNSKSKFYTSMGILSGAFLVIVFI